MPYIPFYDQDEEEDPREYDDPENGYNRPPSWPALKPFDGPEFDDQVPF
jgi:hypothetical protein